MVCSTNITNKPLGELVIKTFWGKTDWTWTFAWYWAKVEAYNSPKRANISNDILHSLWFDLQRKEPVHFKGKKSDLLARFDITGKPFEKVSYHASPDCSTYRHIYRITLSVKGINGELFDFNDMLRECWKMIKGLFEATTILHDEISASV